MFGGMKPKLLQKFLWGKYYFQPKEKKITKVQPSSNTKPIFEKYVM
jgi:hypothetical protein